MTQPAIPVPRPEGAAGAHRAPNCAGGSMACWRIASSSSGRRWRNWKPSWRRSAARSIAWRCQFRHRRDPDRLHGGGHRPRRRGVPARVHLHRDRRGAAGARRHAGVRRCRSAHLPDRSGASGRPHRRGARGRQTAAARADRRRPVRPARRLAGAAAPSPRARTCSRSTTAPRASARRCTARRSAPRPTRPPPASSRRSRWAPMATAARCSPRATSAPRCIAACAPTARAPRATRCCAPA